MSTSIASPGDRVTSRVPCPDAPLRAVLYARVSSDPRQQLRSVSQQIDECTAECGRREWEIVKIFQDNDRSASRYATKERDDYARLLAFLATGGADVLVTWESSRAQRDLQAYVTLRTVAEQYGVQWSYKGRLYDLSRTDDRFTTGLDALLDERESSVTRDRVLRGKRANAAKGRPHGRITFGYQREYDATTGEFVRQFPHPEQATIVREAARRFAAGESLRVIARDFNQRGLTTLTAHPWTTAGVRNMVTNPGYIGKRVHRGVVIGDAVWPPILAKEVFYACVQRLNAPGRRYSAESRARYLLTGIAECGVCGGPCAIRRNNADPAVNRKACVKYICRDMPSRLTGKCISIVKDRLDAYVTSVVVERLSRPDAAELLADQEQADDATAAMAEAAEKRAILDDTADQVARGEMTARMGARIEARLLPEIEAAEQRAAAVRVPAVLRDVIRPDIADVWETLPLGQRREVVRTLCRVVVLPRVRGSRRDTSLRVRIEWKHDV